MKIPGARLGHVLERIPARWQFATFLIIVIVLTLVLTIISYSLYVISGTSQLDLSRPGYKQALSEVAPTDTNDYDYSATGPLDTKALKDFKAKYDSLTGKIKGNDAFDPNALSDEQLNLTQTSPAIGPQ